MTGKHSEVKETTGIAKPRSVGYLSPGPRVSTDPRAELGGPRTHVLGVIQGFTTLGWEVRPYIVGDRVPRKWMAQSAQKLERSVLVRLAADLMRLVMGVWHGYKAWRELKGKVDWVYERYAVLQLMGWIFQRRGIPWILETNGLLFYESTVERKAIILSGLARAMELWAYRRCDVLVCVTEEMKELMVDLAGISPDKVLVVPNGVDTVRVDPEKHMARRLFERPTLGFIGTLYLWRRLDQLLEVLADVRREGVDLNLAIIGDGPMRTEWEKKACDLNLQDCVHFAGWVHWDDALAYVAGFDLGYINFNPVDGSKMSGSPTKLYEYMAMARPVISSTFFDSKEMIVHGQNGYLFNTGDKEDLKRVLHQAFEEKQRWHEIGLAARTRVIEKASWESRVQEMLTGIEGVLKHQDAKLSD